jgi:rhizosphere induced protein
MPHRHLFPIGVVLPYAGPLANTETTEKINVVQIAANLAQAGWLFCDGSQLVIADYRALHGVIGIAYGGDKTHFRVPDLRGRFIRGVTGKLEHGETGRDPESDISKRSASGKWGNEGNRVGSLQSDCFQGHEHNYNGVGKSVPPTLGPGDTPNVGIVAEVTSEEVSQSKDDGKPRVSSETRPVNLYLNYIIRYC